MVITIDGSTAKNIRNYIFQELDMVVTIPVGNVEIPEQGKHLGIVSFDMTRPPYSLFGTKAYIEFRLNIRPKGGIMIESTTKVRTEAGKGVENYSHLQTFYFDNNGKPVMPYDKD